MRFVDRRDARAQTDAELMEVLRRLVASPDDPWLNWQAGDRYLDLGQPLRAVGHYQKVAALRPEDGDARYRLALAARDAGDWRLAREALEAASRLGRESADSYALMADVAMRLGDCETALENARKAMELSNERTLQAWMHYVLGNCRRKLHDLDGQLAHYQAAVDANPEDVEAQYALGVARLEEGNALAAVSSFEGAARLKPEDAALWFALGCAAHAAGNLPRAARALERTLSLGRDDGQTHLELAAVWWKLDDVDAAIRHAELGLAFPLTAQRRNWLQKLLAKARARRDRESGAAPPSRGSSGHEPG